MLLKTVISKQSAKAIRNLIEQWHEDNPAAHCVDVRVETQQQNGVDVEVFALEVEV
jgi:hypothetical protein